MKKIFTPAIMMILVSIQLCASPLPEHRPNYQVTIAYWNDNFINQNFFEKFLKVGNDDYVTFSALSQIAWQGPRNRLIVDLYYNILTNKRENLRFDLFTLRYSLEKDTRFALMQIGTGLVTRGNIGGARIQNTYHRLFGYNTVDLSYVDKTVAGLLFLTKVEPYLLKTSNHTLKVSFINIYRTAAGPSNFRLGLSAIQRITPKNSKICFCLYEQLGYLHYYSRDELTKPLFNEGLGYGLIFSGIYSNRYGISFWTTENQYGRHNSHYGLMFTYNPCKGFAPRLSDTMVP